MNWGAYLGCVTWGGQFGAHDFGLVKRLDLITVANQFVTMVLMARPIWLRHLVCSSL